jgi:hypothetical protein
MESRKRCLGSNKFDSTEMGLQTLSGLGLYKKQQRLKFIKWYINRLKKH